MCLLQDDKLQREVLLQEEKVWKGRWKRHRISHKLQTIYFKWPSKKYDIDAFTNKENITNLQYA